MIDTSKNIEAVSNLFIMSLDKIKTLEEQLKQKDETIAKYKEAVERCLDIIDDIEGHTQGDDCRKKELTEILKEV